MRQAPTHTTHTTGQSVETFRAGIDPKSVAEIIGTLTNLYKDHPLAVVREYSTNAWDSHLEAGQTRPIEVTLPTVDKLAFTVQDFGVGLSHDDLRDVYSQYGASTKRDSEEATGTLGLGCKSALTYAVSFTIDAVKGSVRTIATVSKDADGVPLFRVLDTSATSLPDGVKITIPVAYNDVHKFENRATGLFRFWRPGTVLVNGEEPDNIYDDDSVIWIDDDVALTSEGQSYVVMNNVAYPFDGTAHTGQSVVAYVPTGSVHFTPSRESLNLTTLTQETIATLLDFVNTRALDIVVADIEAGTTEWDRAVRYEKWSKGLPHRIAERVKTQCGIVDRVTFGSQAAYQYHPHHYGRKTTDSWTSWANHTHLNGGRRTLVVTNFPHQPRTLSPGQKNRLVEYRYTHANGYTPERFLLLPTKARLDAIDGHPDVVSWAEIVEATPTVRVKNEGPVSKFKYDVHHQGTVSYLPVIDQATGPILYCIYKGKDRWGYKSSDLDTVLRRHPHAWVVEIQARQVDKFLRLHPTARPWIEYDAEQVEAARKALTDEDRQIMNRENVPGDLRRFSGVKNEIVDPEFVAILDLLDAKPTKRIIEAERLGVGIDGDESQFVEVEQRYPLLSQIRYVDEDAVFYINAKFASLNTNNAEEAQAA